MKTLTIFLSGLLLCGVASLVGQAPTYQRPAPPSRNSAVEIRASYLSAPDVTFRGLGRVPGGRQVIPGNIGTERAIFYDNGELVQDYISVDNDGDGVEEIDFSPRTDVTTNFTYFTEDQRFDSDNDGVADALLFESASAVNPVDADYSGDSDPGAGWEIVYTRYFSDKRALGMEFGFSFHSFDSTFNESIQADELIQVYRHNLISGTIPDLPEEGPYEGQRVREDPNEGALLQWAATLEEIINEGAAEVDSNVELSSTSFNFRFGPTYQLTLGQRFSVRVGAGLTATYYTGEFSVTETLIREVGTEPSTGILRTEQSEWLVGGYVDATAHYWMTRRVSFFGGAQMRTTDDYEHDQDGRSAAVDMGGQIVFHGGIAIRF